ncbi:FAD/NAD(P)-binding domain-containing protein [Coprinopsis marcescibilis]|nr:FAD/NAD(P)-binding domain-containing protein [Coprinopsis marcescibilis]
MKLTTSLTVLAVTALGAVGQQEPLNFYTPSHSHGRSKSAPYKLQWPVKKVVVIGTGVGGLQAYRELTQNGFEVDIYERDNVPGGNWHYSDEIPLDAPIPNAPVAVGDYTPSLPPKGVTFPYVEEISDEEEGSELRRAHRAPKPTWASLHSNAPAPIQQIRETPWPRGTEWALPHQKLSRYIRSFASWHGVNTNDGNPHAFYNTRVEHVERRHVADGWTVVSKEVVKTAGNATRSTWFKRNYDAVVVATGRYNAPNVPAIAGIPEWNKKFPGHLLHSRQYRSPQPFKGQTVLVIGAATSGGEIAREVIQHAKQVYVSVRPESFNGPRFALRDFLSRLPTNVTLVGEIKSFNAPGSNIKNSNVELVNGTVISGLDTVIFGTGFRYTYPFLSDYHNQKLGVNGTLPRVEGVIQPIVTDGTHVRSLWYDSFYIPDPTLLFINANFGMQSFTYAEFIALAAAKVWSGRADLPNTDELWAWYDETVTERRGYGRHFQFLGVERTKASLRYFVSWINEAAVRYGGRQIDQLPKELDEVSQIWAGARWNNANHGSTHPNNLLPGAGHAAIQADGSEAWVQDAVYSDWW